MVVEIYKSMLTHVANGISCVQGQLLVTEVGSQHLGTLRLFHGMCPVCVVLNDAAFVEETESNQLFSFDGFFYIVSHCRVTVTPNRAQRCAEKDLWPVK